MVLEDRDVALKLDHIAASPIVVNVGSDNDNDVQTKGIKTYKNVERKDSLVETALSLGIYLGDDI